MWNKCISTLIVTTLIVCGCNLALPEPKESTFSNSEIRTSVANEQPIVDIQKTSVIKPTENGKKSCLDTSEIIFDSKNFPGSIILSSGDKSEGDYFLVWRTNEKKTFQESGYEILGYSLSPDGDWLSYRLSNENEIGDELLIFQSLYGDDLLLYNIVEKWPNNVFIQDWLDNESIKLLHYSENALDYLSVFNPFTDDEKVLPSNYPYIVEDGTTWRKMSWASVTLYDPTLRYVVYLADQIGSSPIGDYRLILWDRENKKQIIAMNHFGYTMVSPIWNKDGNQVFFVKAKEGFRNEKFEDELYSMSFDGTISQLTDLNDIFNDVNIFSLDMSPNEEYMIIGASASNTDKSDLERNRYILNLKTSEIYTGCIFTENIRNFVWSPDSQFLAYSEELDDKSIRTVILDIENLTRVVMIDNAIPNLWVNTDHLQGYFPGR